MLFGATFLGPDGGAPIGAGLLYILAVPLSVMASTTLLSSSRATGQGPSSPPGRGTLDPSGGRSSAVVSAALLSVVFLLGFMDLLPRSAMTMLLLSGIGAFVLSSLLFAVMRDRDA